MDAKIPNELDRFVESTGESRNIDAKGPLAWDEGVVSAGLAKDIAAFANSRDGGVIVIGKAQTASGAFELTGLTDDQSRSFDTTRVAQWVNQRFDPPIMLVCHPHKYQGKQFVVITVQEFSDVPVICKKSFHDGPSKKHLLRECTIYVRNANAQCAPIATVEEMRELIGLATAKRRDEMLAMFDSLLKGRPLFGAPSDRDQFDKELERLKQELGLYSDRMIAGAWQLVIRPQRFDAARWDDNGRLEALVERRAVKLFDTFPPSRNGTHVREWGICNDHYGEVWTLSRTGQFVHAEAFRENTLTYEAQWRPSPPPIPPGEWMEFTWSLRQIFERTLFAARFAEEYGPGEHIDFTLFATPLTGRKLVTMTSQIMWEPSEECRARSFTYHKNVAVEEFRAEWRATCAESMVRFVEYFPSTMGAGLSYDTALNWVGKFETRDF